MILKKKWKEKKIGLFLRLGMGQEATNLVKQVKRPDGRQHSCQLASQYISDRP